MNLSNDEQNLLCIYNDGTRLGTLKALTEMRTYLEPHHTELLELTDNVIRKLEKMDDALFEALKFFPDFHV